MFIGHFAIGFAAKKFAPKSLLAVLLAAPLFLDILWPIFLAFGWEHVRILPGVANHFQWESVILAGHFHELPDLSIHAEERTHARKLPQQRSLWWDTVFAAHWLKSDSDAILPLSIASKSSP